MRCGTLGIVHLGAMYVADAACRLLAEGDLKDHIIVGRTCRKLALVDKHLMVVLG